MKKILINISGSVVRTRLFYPIVKRYDKKIDGKVKNKGYIFISPSKYEQLCKDKCTQIELRACTENESILIPLLKIRGCDGIVIYKDEHSKRLSVEFVETEKTYCWEYLRYFFPSLGVKQRIDDILLSFENMREKREQRMQRTEAAAQTYSSVEAEAAAQTYSSEESESPLLPKHKHRA